MQRPRIGSRKAWFFNTFVWPLAQLLPFWWHSTYTQEGTQYHAWWRMWFGKVFDYHVVEVKAVIR